MFLLEGHETQKVLSDETVVASKPTHSKSEGRRKPAIARIQQVFVVSCALLRDELGLSRFEILNSRSNNAGPMFWRERMVLKRSASIKS
jgi:hypothetical protein